MNKAVLILGSGPSGMLAAHGASQCGYEVTILDKDPDKSRKTSGLFYLHDSCDLLIDSMIIHQDILGAEGLSSEEIEQKYCSKVYGGKYCLEGLSISNLKSSVLGYNPTQAIERLWDLYGHRIVRQEVKSIFGAQRYSDGKIISTIPAPVFYPLERFESVQVYVRIGESPKNEAFVFYSVSPNHSWYRTSGVFGTFTQEFASLVDAESEYSLLEIVPVTKVIGGFSPPSSNRILFTGRYGAWKKKMLVSDVYYDVKRWLLNG